MEDAHWREPLEHLVKKKAEKCQALYVAHNDAYKWCKTWDTRFQIICIILSTFSGAGAVGSASILPFEGSTTLVGVVSLLVGTIQMVNNRLEFAKRAENHRIVSLAYQKLHTHLDLQLSLPRKEREPATEVIKFLEQEIDRLSEIEPPIPESTKEAFHKRFKDLGDYSLPSTLNGLEPVNIVVETLVSPPQSETPRERPIVRLEL